MRVLRRLWPGLWRDLVLNGIIASPLAPTPFRWLLLRLYGLQVDRCRVAAGVWIGSRRLALGAGTFVSYGCMFNTSAPVTVGRNCFIAMRVTFVTSTHVIGGPAQRAGSLVTAPIAVGDGVWIGANATILPGVRIGDGCVVAAGAVVTRDCDPHGLYAGVPARLIRHLDVDGVETRPRSTPS